MPGEGYRGDLYRQVEAEYRAGHLDRRGSQTRLAQRLGVSRQRINELVSAIRAAEGTKEA